MIHQHGGRSGTVLSAFSSCRQSNLEVMKLQQDSDAYCNVLKFFFSTWCCDSFFDEEMTFD